MEGSFFDTSTGNATLDAIALDSGAADLDRLVEWAVLFGIAVLVTGLRTYSRARVSGLRGLSWDDYLVWAAVIAYANLTIDVFVIGVVSEGLSNDAVSDERRAALAQDGPSSQEFQLRAIGSKSQIAKWLLYALTLWLLKGSLLHFFSGRLTQEIPGAKMRAWFGAGLLFVTWASLFVALFASCRPFKKFWQIFPDPGLMCQPAISPILISVFLTCNILTDLYLISIPVPVLLRARLRTSQKFSLISLFSCNILITGIAVVRAIFMLSVVHQNPKVNGDGMWAVREAFVALVTTNIPPIAPLLRAWLSCCLGRRMQASDGTNEEQGKQMTNNNGPKRQMSTSTAGGQVPDEEEGRTNNSEPKRQMSTSTPRPRVPDDKSVTNEGFSDWYRKDLPGASSGHEEIQLQTWAASIKTMTSPAWPLPKSPVFVPQSHPGPRQGERLDGPAQKAREIV